MSSAFNNIDENDENEIIQEEDEEKPNNSQDSKKEDVLTTSPYPGTTLELFHVEDLHLGYKVITNEKSNK